MMVAGTLAAVPAADAAFVGTNGALVFASNRLGPEDTATDAEGARISDFDIFLTRQGGGVTNLTANNVDLVAPEEGGDPVPTAINDLHPTVSPDGTRVAFTSNRLDPDDGSTDPDIYVMNIDGSNVVQVTADKPGAGGAMGAAQYEPTWSPDGGRLAYRVGDGRNADIWIIELATGKTQRITGLTGGAGGPAGYDAEPAWSPDGTKLLYSNGKGPTVKINVIDLATGADTTVIDAPGLSDATPAWSPDGTRIVFRRGDEGGGAGIWVAPASGGTATQLTDPLGGAAPPEEEGGEPTAYSDLNPAWSPDGTQIAFQSTRPDPGETVAGDPDIYTMAADGSGQTRHPDSAIAVVVPDPPPAQPEPEPDPAQPEEPGGGGPPGEPGGGGPPGDHGGPPEDHGAPALPDSDITPDWQAIPLAGIAAVATPVCKVLPPAPAPSTEKATFTLSERQLLINQRIGQAAIRRLNGVRARLDGGLAARDLCGYSIGASELGSGITSNLAAVSLAPAAPADPAPIVDPGRAAAGDPVTLTARQLLINQRIYQAALRRAQGIENRLNAKLTGGDIASGQVVQGKLSDRLRIVTATPSPEPAPSTTVIPARRTPADPGSVTLDIRQLKINQRIAQAGVRDANALIRRMETGLSGTDLQPGTLTAADLG